MLKGNTGLKNETGVVQKADGTFLDYIPASGNPNNLIPPPGANFMGGIHTHIEIPMNLENFVLMVHL